MSPKKDRDLGTGLIVAAVVFAALSNWDTLINHLPEGARPYAQSDVTAIVLALAGVFFLWRAANSMARLEGHVAAITRSVDEAQLALRRRVEQAEAKLTKALDEQAISWAPALQKLEAESKQRIDNAYQAYENLMRQSMYSMRRALVYGNHTPENTDPETGAYIEPAP
jgi:hypothetical protein